MISSCALSAVQIELVFIIMERLSTVWGNPGGGCEGGDKERGEGGGRGGKSKQSLVNFPEGRPRAWLGRARGRGNQKTALSTNQKAGTVSSSIDKTRPWNKRKEVRVSVLRSLRRWLQRDPNLYLCTLSATQATLTSTAISRHF